MYAYSYKTISELKDAIVSDLDRLPSQIVGKAAAQIQGEPFCWR